MPSDRELTISIGKIMERKMPQELCTQLLLSHLHSHSPVMASWVTKKVILDFFFCLHVENSTVEFPTMVKVNRTHSVISCSVCGKQATWIAM